MDTNRGRHNLSTPNEQHLKIVYWNAQGLRNKYTKFLNFMDINNVHVGLVCETWLTRQYRLQSNPTYTIHRLDRNDNNNATDSSKEEEWRS